MSETKIIIPAELGSYGSRADGSMRLSFTTGIINNEQLLVINALKNSTGYLLFKDSGITKDEENIIDKTDGDVETKTPSQRLRGVLFRNWELENKGHTEFKDYYKSIMEKLINHYKNQLD